MSDTARPFWKILIIAREGGQAHTLNCDECFIILEHLADEALEGVDTNALLKAIASHFSHCPDCREHHAQKLEQLKSRLNAQGYPASDSA
jgi:hypothetical protein